MKTGTKLSLLASLLSFCGCGQAAPTPKEPTLIEELAINGFDPDGEPIIKKWSDGTLGIYFEAMPPFFAEDEGTESEYKNFEIKMQEALGVAVVRNDREVFVIQHPTPETAEKAKAWLEGLRKF